MINEFIGEFMFHPSALEFSGNTCDHNCCYCFANIRKAQRQIDLKSIIKHINRKEVKTFKDALLAEGYSICMSNKSDPFSNSNYVQTIALGSQLKKLKNGIFIQTKGGKGIDEFLKAIEYKKNIIWYITITTLNEKIRKRTEPGAPSTEERFTLAGKLKDLGYHVILAINPILEKWMPIPDVIEFCNKAKSIGITSIITEALHLNKVEVSKFSEERLNSFEQDEIDYSLPKATFQDYVKKVVKVLIENGIDTVKIGMPYKTNLYKPIREIFKNIFPNQYDIINLAHQRGVGIYSFDQFYDVSVDNKQFFERSFKDVNKYILKMNIHEWAANIDCKKIFTLKGVLNLLWNNQNFPQSMIRNTAFRLIVDDNLIPVKDKSNNVLLYFDYGVYPTQRIINIKKIKDEKIN